MSQDRELLTRYIRGRGCWCCGRGARERMYLRQLGDLIYKRFAILPNVEDQKVHSLIFYGIEFDG